MKLALKDFQEEAVDDLVGKIRYAADGVGKVGLQAVVLSAPTGSGKTVIMTAVIEQLLQGDDRADPDPDATFLWITDLPELNEQTRGKMEATSSVLNAFTLRVIDSSFDQPRLDDGTVYFLNTQKLGRDKLLTQRGDGRSHTIWEIIDRTITEKGGGFYVVIDEAHRGMRTTRQENEAQSIIQRFLIGYEVMAPAPVVIGVSATPQRFDDLLSGLDRTINRHDVDVDAVRESGLLKDRIVLHHLADDQQADMTLLAEAAREWTEFDRRWKEYAKAEGTDTVEPILVVQVEDAPKGQSGTRTPLDQAIESINEVRQSLLPAESFAHAFDDGNALEAGSRTIRYLKPSQIARDRDVDVVFFKTALSTGWDCPQAEVMMSFRRAVDATYIAQLIGRMVRTPLARRIERDETLNSVALFLPHYDAEGVARVIKRLQDPEHEYVPPVGIEQADDSQTLTPAEGTEPVLEALAKAPSYIVPSARRAKQTIRLMRLTRALARDKIDEKAHDRERSKLVKHLKEAVEDRQADPEFTEVVDARGQITIGEIVFDQRTGELETRGNREVTASDQNVNDLFAEAGRRIGEGLHKALWESLCKDVPDHDLDQIRKAKIQVSVLLADADVIRATEDRAESRSGKLHKKHRDAIESLAEKRRTAYRELLGRARQPTETTIRLPDRIVLPKRGEQLDRHLYVNDQARFSADLNSWETAVLEAELNRPGIICWLRNEPRKEWALQVPYEDGSGIHRALYPDFLVFHQADGRVEIDILDPHDPSRGDALDKAKGLAKFAENHGAAFGRIEIISVKRDRLFRLDLQNRSVREAVSVLNSAAALERLYDRGYIGLAAGDTPAS